MNDFDNYDLAKMDVDLSTLLDDFPADVSTGDTDTSTPMADLLGFSPLGAAFEPRTLAELLEVENQMLDDQGWLWEDGLLESALAMDTPPHNVSRREPRMVAFAETFLVPTKTHNFSKVLCPDFTYSPALSRPAIADSHAVFATQFLLRGQQNKVIIWDMEAAGVAQQIVDVREAAHSFVWLEQGSRVAFACGASIGMMQVGQMWAQRPFYAPVFHEAPIRDMEVCKLGPNKVISGANDGTVVGRTPSVVSFFFFFFARHLALQHLFHDNSISLSHTPTTFPLPSLSATSSTYCQTQTRSTIGAPASEHPSAASAIIHVIWNLCPSPQIAECSSQKTSETARTSSNASNLASACKPICSTMYGQNRTSFSVTPTE